MLAKVMYGMLYIWLNFMRLIGWFRWSIEGLENLPPRESGGMIVAMNHVSSVDIPAIGALLPFSYLLSWLAKSEIFQNSFIGWWLRTMQVIPIRRGKGDLAALDAAVDALRAGAVLLIFPEGHRSRDGVLQPGRGGAIRLAMQAGVPIVPIAVIGSEHDIKGSFLRKPLHMRVGKSFTVEPTADGKVPPDVMERLTTDMMQRIAALLPAERRGPYAALPAPAEG